MKPNQPTNQPSAKRHNTPSPLKECPGYYAKLYMGMNFQL